MLASAVAPRLEARTGFHAINMGELGAALLDENKSGQPLTVFCTDYTGDGHHREMMKIRVGNVLRQIIGSPRFVVMFANPINQHAIRVGLSRSGQIRFFSS